MNDKGYISKQIEAQVCLKQNLLSKFGRAKEKYEIEVKKRAELKAKAKVDAYKNWRNEETRKGKAYDEQCKNWVKTLMKAVKDTPTDPVMNALSHVVGNIDGNF